MARIAGPLARILAEIARLRELPLTLAERAAAPRPRRPARGGRRPP